MLVLVIPLHLKGSIRSGSTKNSDIYNIRLGYQFSKDWFSDVLISHTRGVKISEKWEENAGDTDYQVYNPSKLANTSLLVNAYYNLLKPTINSTVYIGGGIGIGQNTFGKQDLTSTVIRGSGDNIYEYIEKRSVKSFVWNIAAGVNIKLNQNWDLNGEYRHINYGKFKEGKTIYEIGTNNIRLNNPATLRLKTNIFTAGIIYKF